ncbi:MAG TPA: response regulator [Cyclobacteriaceae bacterium]|jgi:CheY-like chemotaxis protein|nr:response regulator [Cyclobacteriaceae bacterium]
MIEKERNADVLFVEDNQDDSELTEFAMTQANDKINFIHFNDGIDALNFIFAKNKYEGRKVQSRLKLVLLDLRLPTMNGLEVLRQIRQAEATKTVPVVILTSSKDQHDIDIAYQLGVNSYVVKPEGFDGYVKKVEALTFYWSAVNERPY